ncbi:hypothetical protein EJ02DRAFT_117719 [Clathrospora elynae]|uniref:Uncharacterized protein n=1 Tax=Clathrospora elynae TaxID=706981 RepID=A0A6A5SVT3_9PLEO|nr:hypothetical protein EJ02DRAFT_117719 [Clathrospora elynae]
MSAPHTNTDVALPHASLLEYFRNPAAASEPIDSGALLPLYSECIKPHQLLHPPTENAKTEDEQFKCGAWGEHLPKPDDPAKSTPTFTSRYIAKGADAFSCIWCATSVIILTVFGVSFLLDLGLTQYGLGTGMAQWVMYQHHLPPNRAYSMHFCLETPNREAPGPQMWRRILPGTIGDCTTETAVFFIKSNEAWKVHPDDGVVLGDGKTETARS